MSQFPPATFRCGHPFTPDNTWGRKDRKCKQCCQARKRGERTPTSFKGDGVTTWKSCGHKKTAENTWQSGKYPCCRECQSKRTHRYYYSGPVHPRKRLAAERLAALKPDYSGHPSVELYRAEKARKAALAPAMPVITMEARRPMKMRLLWARAS